MLSSNCPFSNSRATDLPFKGLAFRNGLLIALVNIFSQDIDLNKMGVIS